MAREALRRLLGSHLGAPGRALLVWRTRGQAERLLADRGLTAPIRALSDRLGARVARGPFAGTEYPRRRGDAVHAAKLLGAYESELHAAVERLVARAPACVVNIGSGDGYYAVGLARRLPQAEAWAVDPDPLAQRACRDTARRNGVDARCRLVPLLDATALDAVLQPHVAVAAGSLVRPGAAAAGLPARDRATALCVVDCEGFEDDLLDPKAAPALRHSDLLVETHDFARPGVTERLAQRFRDTHDVERLEIASRDPTAFPELAAFPPDIARGLLDEFRHPPQSWLVLTARVAPPVP